MSLHKHHEPGGFEITISLTHDAGSYWNYVQVEGPDSDWVNGTIKSIEETIESFTPQNPFVLRHSRLTKSVLALGIGIIYLHVLLLIPSGEPSSPAPLWVDSLGTFFTTFPSARYVFRYGVAFLLGIGPALLFFSVLRNLWPPVELQIGPEHSQIEKRRRKLLWNVVVFGVLPILYDIFKLILPRREAKSSLRQTRLVNG